MALIALREAIDGDYSRHMPIHVLDKSAIIHAEKVFADYMQRGVIVSGTFDDMSWTFTNETKNVGLTLFTFETGSKKTAMRWIGCTYHQYVLCVKAYILFNLGEVTLVTLQILCRFFNRLALATEDEAIAAVEYATHVVTLLQLIPGGNERRDAVIEQLEEIIERQNGNKRDSNPRQLADFKSYLRFNEVMTQFWLTADKRQKLFYFPLYFWWNLTAILPLRVTEFLLTPQKCLHVNNGDYLLTIRRTKLKGGRERIKYRIADDYELREYVIHEPLAAEIQWYIEAIGGIEPEHATGAGRNAKDALLLAHATGLDTLIAQEPHYEYIGIPKNPASRYYTYQSLCTCLRYFYNEVVEPGNHDIVRIHLGDTRHLAMTNLILSGGSPVVCRELAGHANIETSSNYYANISNLVECLTIERFRKINSPEALIHGDTKYPLTAPMITSRVEGGRCKSVSYSKGYVDDCLKVIGRDGYIGDCRRCGNYLPNNPGVTLDFYDDDAAKKQVDADCRYLIRMVELVRKGVGCTEDIGTALHRLQHSGGHYGRCLLERLSREET